MRRPARVTAILAVLIVSAPSLGIAEASTSPSAEVPGATTSADAIAADLRPGFAEAFNKLIESTGALGSYRRADGVAVVVVPASGSSTFAASDAASLGITVAIEKANVELSDIQDVKDRIAEIAWKPAPGVADPITFFHARTGALRIYSDAPWSTFASVGESYPGKIEYVGRGIALTTRLADFSPHWGGARMVSPQLPAAVCSSGFAVVASGSTRMMTAGHCWLSNWTVNSPSGNSFGTVVKRTGYPTNDFEEVDGSGISHGGSIYVGGATGTSVTVYTAIEPSPIGTYCFSGATTYENCTLEMIVSDISICATDYWGVAGCRTHVMVFEGDVGRGSCGGDSGAPFFSYAPSGDVAIRGLVWAGESWPNDPTGCNNNAKTVIIEKWTKIRDEFGVTIKTG